MACDSKINLEQNNRHVVSMLPCDMGHLNLKGYAITDHKVIVNCY
jgi:hypothetical protein